MWVENEIKHNNIKSNVVKNRTTTIETKTTKNNKRKICITLHDLKKISDTNFELALILK